MKNKTRKKKKTKPKTSTLKDSWHYEFRGWGSGGGGYLPLALRLLEQGSEWSWIARMTFSCKSHLAGSSVPHPLPPTWTHSAGKEPSLICTCAHTRKMTSGQQTAKQRERRSLRARTHAHKKSFCCPKIKCWGRKRYYSWIKWEKMVKRDIKMQHTGISLPL